MNVKSVRIADVRPVDESENTVNYNDDDDDDDSNNNGYLQHTTTNLISGKWYTVQCWAEGASPKATIEWSIDGNGTLADEEIPSPPTSARITVMEVSDTIIVIVVVGRCVLFGFPYPALGRSGNR